MSESNTKKTTTQKFIERFPNCALCGGLRSTTSREHCPPKSLFPNNHRPDGFIAPSCDECQNKTRTADLVVSIMSRWGYAPDEDIFLDHGRLSNRLRSQAPDVVKEWLSLGPNQRKRARKILTAGKVYAPDNYIVKIGPSTIPYLNVFAQKFALSSYFHIAGEPVSKNGLIWAIWKTKEDVQSSPIPDELKLMVGDSKSLKQGSWDTKKYFEYRHAYNENDKSFIILARFNIAFFVIAFVAGEGGFINQEPGWFSPQSAFDEARTVRRIS